METNVAFLLKLLISSAALAIVIKYAVPLWDLPASPAIALGLVLSPTLILAGLMGWRSWQESQ